MRSKNLIAPNSLLRAGAGAVILASSLLTVAHAQDTASDVVTDATVDAVAAAPVDAPVAAIDVPRVPMPASSLAQSMYGMNVFLYNNPNTTGRDLRALQQSNFGWQKSLFK